MFADNSSQRVKEEDSHSTRTFDTEPPTIKSTEQRKSESPARKKISEKYKSGLNVFKIEENTGEYNFRQKTPSGMKTADATLSLNPDLITRTSQQVSKYQYNKNLFKNSEKTTKLIDQL